jgi:transposase
MLGPAMRCVVGIDVAKQAQGVCALQVPSGVVRHKPSRMEATAQGYALRRSWLPMGAAGGPAETVLIGLEATGSLWEPLSDTLTQAGYPVLRLNPRQTASWAASRGLRATTDGIAAHTLARGLAAGWARGSTLPAATVQALRARTRARRDLGHIRTMTRQRLHDELVVRFPAWVRVLPTLPGRTDRGDPAILQLLSASRSAHALAQLPRDELTGLLAHVSGGRWGPEHAQALQALARNSTASSRAVAARSIVARTLAQQLRELAAHVAEGEAALAQLLHDAVAGQQLQARPGSGPHGAATIRAELGDVTRFGRVDEVVAYAGLDPRTRHSGAVSGQKPLAKRGPGALRHAR